MIVTRHAVGDRDVWALHGHLSADSIREATLPGAAVAAGQVLGWFGNKAENGGWGPHLHFQLALEEPATHDMPGVVATSQRAAALALYPDPRAVLGDVYEGEGLFERAA